MVPFSWWRRQAVPLHEASPAAWEYQNLRPLSVGPPPVLKRGSGAEGHVCKSMGNEERADGDDKSHQRWGGFDFMGRRARPSRGVNSLNSRKGHSMRMHMAQVPRHK